MRVSSAATIEIRPERELGRVDPLIYGQFLSRRRGVADQGLHWPGHPKAGPDGIRADVRQAIADLRPTVIRWPGGCTGTTYHWQDGVGPSDRRPRTLDWHFGYDVGNGFGTAEFVAFCRSIGAEPHINLTTGGGSMQEALDWVEYANGTGPSKWAERRRADGYADPFRVPLWQIGNEEWGAHEIGHCTPEEYGARAREWGKAIKKLDPALRTLAVGCWKDDRLIDWNLPVLREAWDHIDFICPHPYWDFNPAVDDGYERIAAVGYLEERKLEALSGLIDLVARERGSSRRPRIAFTEWNCRNRGQREMSRAWSPTRTTQYRLVDALACAGFLNALQRQCRNVGLATFAQPVNVVGALMVTEEQVVRETVYWALWLQRRYSGPVALGVDSDCPGSVVEAGSGAMEVPVLDVSATASESGDRIWLSIVNRGRKDAVTACVRVRDRQLRGEVVGRRLWWEDALAGNTPDDPDRITPRAFRVPTGGTLELELPPHSYTVLELPR